MERRYDRVSVVRLQRSWLAACWLGMIILCVFLALAVWENEKAAARIRTLEDALEERDRAVRVTETGAPQLADKPRAVPSAPAEAAPTEEPDPTAGMRAMGTFTATNYCPCRICCGEWADKRPKDENGESIVYTASGTRAQAGRTAAVDPAVIPMGSRILIRWPDGTEEEYVAEDRGGAIRGNRIDLYRDGHREALEAGMGECEVWIDDGEEAE